MAVRVLSFSRSMERTLEQVAMKEVEVSLRATASWNMKSSIPPLPLRRTVMLLSYPETLYFLSPDLCAALCWAALFHSWD